MRDTFGIVYWGSSTTVPVVPTSLQYNLTTDESLGTYDLSSIAGTGYWAIAVPVNLNPVNTVRFNDSPIELLPVTESTSVTFAQSDVTTQQFTIAGVGLTQGILLDKASQFAPGQHLSITDGSNVISVQIINLENANRVSAQTLSISAGTPGNTMANGAAVTSSKTVAYTVSRSPVSLIGFNSLSLTTLGGP